MSIISIRMLGGAALYKASSSSSFSVRMEKGSDGELTPSSSFGVQLKMFDNARIRSAVNSERPVSQAL